MIALFFLQGLIIKISKANIKPIWTSDSIKGGDHITFLIGHLSPAGSSANLGSLRFRANFESSAFSSGLSSGLIRLGGFDISLEYKERQVQST